MRIFYPRFNKDEVLKLLCERLGKLEAELPLSRVVLFGSYAKGRYNVGSDIDLLIVYRGEEREDAYATTKRLLDLPLLEPHLYTEEQHKKLKSTLDKMAEGGIELYPGFDS